MHRISRVNIDTQVIDVGVRAKKCGQSLFWRKMQNSERSVFRNGLLKVKIQGPVPRVRTALGAGSVCVDMAETAVVISKFSPSPIANITFYYSQTGHSKGRGLPEEATGFFEPIDAEPNLVGHLLHDL